MIHKVSKQEIQDLMAIYSAHKISTDGHLAGIKKFRGIRIAVTGGRGVGDPRDGWEEVTVYKVVPLSEYAGRLKPLNDSDHWRAVDKGLRPRSYAGMKVRYKREDWVFVGRPIYVQPEPAGTQLDLFTI